MTFLQEAVKQSLDIWEQCIELPFIQELKTGELPFDKFTKYMIQDSIYLKKFARIYGKAIYHAVTLREIQMYYSMLNFVNDGESVVRLEYLKKSGLTDDDIELLEELPENKAYTDFMFEVAERGDNREIMMTILPCMLSYCYIFRKMVKEQQGIEKTKYADFIFDYASDGYLKRCEEWSIFADNLCKDTEMEQAERLKEIFRTASLYELDFWKMAYGK